MTRQENYLTVYFSHLYLFIAHLYVLVLFLFLMEGEQDKSRLFFLAFKFSVQRADYYIEPSN